MMTKYLRNMLMACAIFAPLISFQAPIFAADADVPVTSEKMDIKELAEEVDLLQIVTDMKLKADQISFILARIDFLKKKFDETQKKEKSLLLEIQEPLNSMRDALLAGKDAPSEAQRAAYSKLKPIRQTRQDMQTALSDAANSCVDMLDDGQRRIMARTPDVIARAQSMVQQVTSAPEDTWPQKMAELVAEIMRVKETDRYADWQAQSDSIQNLPASQRDQALQDFDAKRKEELDQMRGETEQLLQSVRMANRQALPIALNKLAAALKSQTELRFQLYDAMIRLLDSKSAPATLTAKLDALKQAAEKKAPK